MPDENAGFGSKEAGKLGGKARSKALSKERRSEIARAGGLARSAVDLPYATHDGDMDIAGRRIVCAVLNTRKRVLTQETFLTAVGRAAKAKGGKGSSTMQVDGLPPFLAAENLRQFISNELREATTPIIYRTKSGGRAYGFDAMLLPYVCEVYLKARDAHMEAMRLNPAGPGVLLKTQEHIVRACDTLMRGLARVGIIALVDKATGYADQQTTDELFRVLEAYISPNLIPYTKRFPDEFFKQVYRTYGWKYQPGSTKRPQCVGQFINKYIYDQLPEGVLPRLRELNPVMESGRRQHKHYNYLTVDTGDEHLNRQVTAVQTLLQVASTKKEFDAMFAKIARVGTRPALVVSVKPPRPNELRLFPLEAEQPGGTNKLLPPPQNL
jgi:general stress protein YciG